MYAQLERFRLMRWSRAVVWLAAFVMATLSVLGVISCAQPPTSQCAGQCAARSMVIVVFKIGIQRKAAESALAACVKNPDVIRVSPFSTTLHPPGGVPAGQHGSHLTATIYVRMMNQTAKSLALVRCLSRQPSILDAAGKAYTPIHGAG
jgi:hypothetical protein